MDRYACLLLALLIGFACGGDPSGPVPLVEVEPRFLEFGVVAVGDESALVATLINQTNDPIDLDTLLQPAADFNPTFRLDTNATKFDPKARAMVFVTFAPTATGEFRSTVDIRAEGIPSLQLSVHGFAYEPTLAVSPPTLQFPTTVVGTVSTATLTVTNLTDTSQRVSFSGEAVRPCALDQSLADFCHEGAASIGANETQTFEISFVPEVAATQRTATLTLSTCSADVCRAPVELLASSVKTVLTCSPQRIDFAGVDLGECRTQTFGCANIGNVPIELLTVQVQRMPADDVYVIDPPAPDRLRPGETFDTTVRFCPLQPGRQLATLVVQTDDLDPDYRNRRLPISGVGGRSTVRVTPETLDFGDVAVGAPARLIATVDNLGTIPLRIIQAGIEANDANGFSMSSALIPDELMPGESWRIPIDATTSTTGTVSATFFVTTDDPETPRAELPLSARGVVVEPCMFSFNPAALDLFDVEPFRVRRRDLDFINEGTAPCIFTSARTVASSRFTITSTIPGTYVAPNERLPIGVEYAAAATTRTTEMLEFSVSNPVQPRPQVSVQVESTANIQATVAPTEIDFGVVGAGCGERTRTVRVYARTTLTLENAELAAPIPPGFELRGFDGPTAIDSFTPVELTVAYTPTLEGRRTSTLVVRTVAGANYQRHALRIVGERGTRWTEERFTQLARRRADVLFVVEPSVPTRDVRAQIGAAFDRWITFAASQRIDYRIGVVSAFDATGRGRLIRADGVDLYGGPRSNRFVTAITAPSPGAVFSQNIFAPHASTARRFFAATDAALDGDQLLADNDGFIRNDASLSVVYVARRDDTSTSSAEFVADNLFNMKGPRGQVSVHGIIGDTLGCGEPAPRLTTLIRRMHGETISFCAKDLSAELVALAPKIFGLRTRFGLKGVPDPSTISVTIDGRPSTGWTWSDARQEVLFETAPAPGAVIVFRYRTPC